MPTYTDIYANLRKGSSSLTVNEFPRFISENDKHLRVKSNIFTNIAKISYKIPTLSKYFFEPKTIFQHRRTIAMTKICKIGIYEIVFCCLSATLPSMVGMVCVLQSASYRTLSHHKTYHLFPLLAEPWQVLADCYYTYSQRGYRHLWQAY